MTTNLKFNRQFSNLKSKFAARAFSLVAGLFLSVNLSQASTLVEDFKYASGGLDGKNGGSGFAGAWGAAGTSFSTVNAAIDLVFTGGGYAIVQTNSSGSFYSAVAAGSYRGGVRVPSSPLTNAVWFSALMLSPDANGSGFVGFNSSNTNVSSAPYKYYPSSSYNVGISGSTLTVAVGQSTGGGGWTSYTATTNNGLTPSATHLILGRIVFQAYGNVDCLQVWADPADLAHLGAPQWQEVTRDTGTNIFNITVGAGGSGAVDAIRFSDGNGNETNAYVAVTGTTNLNPFTPPPVPPPAPTGLSATSGSNSIALKWNAVPTATSYNVYRSWTSGGTYSVITNLVGTNCLDGNNIIGQKFYTVTALNALGESFKSSEVSAALLTTNQYSILKFIDEFDGSKIDTTIWKLGDGYTVPGGRTNVSVSGGVAHFNIGYDGVNWLTGWINTIYTVQKYGTWVSRYRLAQTNGLNNAFWTATAAANKSFDDIEIDINEGHWPYSTDNTLTSHIWNHCVTPNVATLAYGTKPAYDWTQYHTNVLEWRTDNSLHFFLDGVEYTSSTQGLNNAGVMGPQELIFSTMYGTSHGPGTGLTNTSMDVDYVRLYQKPGWGGSASGSWTNAANWGPDGVPSTNVAAVFNQATTNTTITLPSDKWCQSLYFDMPSTPALTLAAGNTLHLGCTNSTGRGGIILGDSLTTPQNINVNIKGETELEFGNYSSSGVALYLNGKIYSSAGESNVFFLGRSWSPAIYVNGQLDASMHNLTLDYGSLWLNASNALTGTIYVNSSTLFVGANSALGNNNDSQVSGSVVLASNVNYTASHTLHLLSSGYGGYSPLDVLNSTNVIFAGAISCETAASGIGSKIPVGGVLRLTGPITLNGNTLTLQGAGTISLEGNCAFASGTCNFQCATLAGTGILDGPTTIADGKTLAPGGWNSIGTLTINNSLTLGGPSTKTIFRLSKDGGLKSDKISGLTSVDFAGSLIVTNLGSTPLAMGDTFQLFSAGGYGGGFSAIMLPALAAPLTWDTSNLSVDGSITVTGPTNPVIQPVAFDGTGTNLLLQIDTQTGYNYVLQNTTNLTPPVTWVSQFTNIGSGLTVTNAIPVSRSTPKRFYRYMVQ